MLKTASLLIFTLVIVPLIAFKFGTPLTAPQLALLKILSITTVAIALACFLVSEITKNYSQTDKLWSITPIIYVWIATAYSDWNIRMIFLSVLVSLWGIRLTYNFSRRGGYSLKFWEGEEDYRWTVLKQYKPLNIPWVFTIFNLLFISLYQHLLILFFTLPIILSIHTSTIFWYDYVLASLMLLFIAIETKADQEQWNYQTEKHKRINNKEELSSLYKKGFVHTGLWGIVRHPNYAAEQAIWITFYLFSISATGQWINWSIMGCLLLVVLFKSSSDFSEKISASKYSDYSAYQKKIGKFLPKFV